MTPQEIMALSDNDLKALAYDCLARIEANQKDLQAINQILVSRKTIPAVAEAPVTPPPAIE